MALVDRPLRGFARIVAAIGVLSMTTATLQLKLKTWIKARSDPTQTAIAIASRPSEPISRSTAPDLAPPAAVAVIAMATRPPASTSPSAGRDLASPAVAPTPPPKRPREQSSSSTTVTREGPDLASPAAAAAKAKAVVEQSFGIPNAKISEPVVAKGIADGNSVDGGQRPRYQAEVVVEIPRGFGAPVQRLYFLTLHYVGGGEWQIEGMKFATKY